VIKQLVWLTVVLSVMLLSGVGGAILIGRAMLNHPLNPMPGYGFALCSENPCFRGVTPGITEWRDPQVLTIQGHLGEQANSSVKTLQLGNHSYASVFNNGTLNRTSRWVVFFVGDDAPTLADLVLFYGLPCRVAASNTGNVGLYFSGLSARVLTPNDSFEPSSRLDSLVLDGIQWCNLRSLPPRSETEWLGFASVDRYARKSAVRP